MIDEAVKDLIEQIKNRISKRIHDNLKAFNSLGINKFYIAGGALLEPEPNDYDLFQVEPNDFRKNFSYFSDDVIQTANAATYLREGIKIQLCRKYHSSLRDLIEGFDFSHCKIGAKFEMQRHDAFSKDLRFVLTDFYISPDFIRYKIIGDSEYCKDCDFPLAALIRVHKYVKKGYIKNSSYTILKILEHLLQRGWSDDRDFVAQLSGIYVGHKEIQDLIKNKGILQHIYYLVTGRAINNSQISFHNGLIIKGCDGEECTT